MLPEIRRPLLKKRINETPICQVIEAHNGLSAVIGTNAIAGEKKFSGLWISSFTESLSQAYPDEEILGFETRLALIQQICMVSPLPLIVDGDTGGSVEQLIHRVRILENLGVSALVIEDKVFPKKNSFADSQAQELAEPEHFCRKISAARKARRSPDFMIIARTEALILGAGLSDALSRADKYVEAGADAILVHSKLKNESEVLSFAAEFRKSHSTIPLVAVPTSYNQVSASTLEKCGFSMIIHANHLLRAANQAMQHTARSILAHDRSYETNDLCTNMKDLIDSANLRFSNPWSIEL
jgi:phosphoenolpyruvate phosphomutase